MLWYCRIILWTALVLSFWAKGKLMIRLSGDTTWFRGFPFYAWKINSDYGVNLNWGNLAGNLICFALLYMALNINFSGGARWRQRLIMLWLTFLPIFLIVNLYMECPPPVNYSILSVVFWSYAAFSGWDAILRLVIRPKSSDVTLSPLTQSIKIKPGRDIMTKRKTKIIWVSIAVAVGALLFFPAIHWVQKQTLRPLLKPYKTAQIPDFRNLPQYQNLADSAAHASLPVVGLNVDPKFNGQLSDPNVLKNLSDFIALNAAFMENAPIQLSAAGRATIVNNRKNIKAIEESLGWPALMSRFYHIKLEYDIARKDQGEAFHDLVMIHRSLTELVKFPYVFAHHYFLITLYRETSAVRRLINCFKLTPQQLSEIAAMLHQSETLLPQSFNNAISSAAYFLLFAPMADRQIAMTNRDYPLTIREPDKFPAKPLNYSVKELYQRERFFMKYLAFANTGLFDFSNYRNVKKSWEQYQKDLKDCPGRQQHLQNDINLEGLYQGYLYYVIELHFSKTAVAVRLFEAKNQRSPSSLEELIKQNLITATDTINPFTGEAIQLEQGVFPVLQESRYIDNRNQDRYEDCQTIRLSCSTPRRTLQYFVVNQNE